MIDLEIAKALGIPVEESGGGTLEIGETPYIYFEITNIPCYIFRDKDNICRYFHWSLDGPDAGNTMLVILNAMRAKRYDVVTTLWSNDRVEIYKDGSIVCNAENRDRNICLALRAAAAKALGVKND